MAGFEPAGLDPEQAAMLAIARAYYAGLQASGQIPEHIIPFSHFTPMLGSEEGLGVVWTVLWSIN